MPDTLLTDQPVLVTGGSSGLGAAVVERLLAAGAVPAVIDLAAPKADVRHELVDLADARAAERIVAGLAAEVGGFRGVVTAAGIDACGRLEDVPAAAWDRVVAVNLLGTAAVVRASLPTLRSGGRIVTVASTLGYRALSDATAYCASKFGVVGFTRALSKELEGRVGVTLLVPGGMRTAFFDGRDPKYQPGPDADLADALDVADAALFALTRPPGVSVRELLITPPTEGSWP